MRVCRTLVLAAAFVVLESGASQDILPSSFLYNPPRDGGPPEDIKMLFKSRGPGVQSLGGASPVYTLVMERQQPLQPRNTDGETHVIAASEPDPSANNERESLVNFMEPDTSTMPAGSGYSSTMSSKDRGSSAMTSSNKESSVKPSADFDLSTLLITDSGSPSIPSTVNIVSNSTVMPGSVLKPDSILNIADTKAHPNSHGIQNSATEFYAFGGGNDIAGEATATTMEDLQGAHTNAANADTLSVDSGENALTDSTNGYDFSENLVTSSTDISDLEESASSTDKYVHTNRNNFTADEDFITFNGDESFTIFTGDGEYTEMPVITNTNTFIVGSGHASTARPQDQTVINTFSSDDPLPTRQRADIDPHLSEYSGDQFPASQQEDNDLAESQISADYVPLSNHDVEKSDSPAEPREDFSYFGLRNHFYHDGDLTLQVLGGGKSGDVKEDSEENPWEERTGDSGKESQERDLYFVLERDPKDAGRVTVKLGKSREAGRARANEHEPLDGRDDADNLYQYHLHDHKSGSYRFGFGGDNQWRHEERRADGVVLGRYGWQDATGRHHTTHYVADARGFRVVRPGQQIKVHVPSSTTTTTEYPALTALSMLTEGSVRSPIASYDSPAPANYLPVNAITTSSSPRPFSTFTTPRSPTTQTYPPSSSSLPTLPQRSQTPRPSILPPKNSRPPAEGQSTSPSAFLIPNNPWSLFVTTQTARPLVASRPPPRPTILFSEASTSSTDPPEVPTTLFQASPSSTVPTTTTSAFPTTTPSDTYPQNPRPVSYRPLPTRLSPTLSPSEYSGNAIEGTNGTIEGTNETQQIAVVTGRPPIAHPLPHQSVVPPYPGSWVYVQPPGSQRPPPPFRPPYGKRPIIRPFRPVNRRPPLYHKVKPLRPLQPNIGASSHYKPNRFAEPEGNRNPEHSEANSTKTDSGEIEVEYNELDNLPSASSPGTSEDRYPQLLPGYYRKGNRPFQLGNNATESTGQSGGEESLVDLINLIKFLVPPTQLQPPRFVPGEGRPPRPAAPWGSDLLGASVTRPPSPSQAETVGVQDQTTGKFPLDYAFMDEDYISQGTDDSGSTGPDRNQVSQNLQAIDPESKKNSTDLENTISNEIGSANRPAAEEHIGPMKWKLSVLDPHDAEEESPEGPPFDLGALDGDGGLEETTLRVWAVSSSTTRTSEEDPSSVTDSASEEASTDAVWPYVSPGPSNSTNAEGSTLPPPPPPQQGFWPNLLKELYYWPNSQNRRIWPVLH